MFDGWLIKFGGVTLPNSFLLADGWESTPNQRIDISAHRDGNVKLHRDTSGNFKTSLSLTIRGLTLAEMTAFHNVIGLATLAITDKRQRKLAINYWNDEELDYKYAEMYMADVTYSHHTIDEENKDISYNPFTIELVEY